MNELTAYLFTHTTGEDQQHYFSGEFGSTSHGFDNVTLIDIEPGSYRMIDGQLYQIKTALPPALVECK
jgi:hypothetical protein